MARAIFNLMLEKKIQVGKFFEDHITKWISDVEAYYSGDKK